MASKYLQKFPVPSGFQEVLHDFSREVLRAQPEDIIQFAVQYFDFKVQNPDVPFPQNLENLKYNIARKDMPKEYSKVPYDQLSGNASKKEAQQKEPSVVSRESQKQQSEGSRNNNQNQKQQQSNQELDVSRQSGKSSGSHVTHPEEKQLTKEFMGEMYNSALQQTVQDGNNQQESDSTSRKGPNDTSHMEEKQEAKNYTSNVYSDAISHIHQSKQQDNFQYEGPVEEYEQAALKIQRKYKQQKGK